MLRKTATILECSRVFSLPMTICSWLVVFVFSAINSGNIGYGLVAFIGLVFAHLGANLVDDYFDYKFLIRKVGFNRQEYLKNSQKTKCRYLVSGVMSESKVLLTSATYFSIALFLGVFLYFKCGVGVLYFGLAGALIALLYPFMSRICL